jgi:hypothetical protein
MIMNSRSRRDLNASLDLPEGYQGEEYDDFINCDRHKDTLGSLRVVRVVGPQRFLMLFTYERGGTSRFRVHRNYRTMYLTETGDLTEFNPKRIYQEAQMDAKDRCNVSFDRVISEWLAHNTNAMTFTGRGWADRCAKEIDKLVGWWEDRYDPTLPKREGEL